MRGYGIHVWGAWAPSPPSIFPRVGCIVRSRSPTSSLWKPQVGRLRCDVSSPLTHGRDWRVPSRPWPGGLADRSRPGAVGLRAPGEHFALWSQVENHRETLGKKPNFHLWWAQCTPSPSLIFVLALTVGGRYQDKADFNEKHVFLASLNPWMYVVIGDGTARMYVQGMASPATLPMFLYFPRPQFPSIKWQLIPSYRLWWEADEPESMSGTTA